MRNRLFKFAQGYLGLELDNSTVRYVYLKWHWGQYRIEKAGTSDQKVDLFTPGSLSAVVNNILEKEKFCPARISIAISGHDIVIHQMTLPKMSDSELAEVVSVEIEKIPIFYHRNFEYFYFKSGRSGKKNKVIFAAVGQNLLDLIIKDVRDTRISFRDIEVAPINLKDLLLRSISAKKYEVAMILQDKHSYFAVLHKNQYAFLYKSPIGSEQLFSAAHKQQKELLISNWTAEVKRALKSFLIENKGIQLERIWLFWDESLLPELDKTLAENVGLSVEVLQPNKVPGIKVKKGTPFNSIFFLSLTPIFLRLKNIKSQLPLDYFFCRLRLAKTLLKTATLTFAYLALLVFSAGVAHQNFDSKTTKLIAETQDMSIEHQKLLSDAQQLMQKKKDYMVVRQRLLTQATYVQELKRVSWAQVLSEVAKEMPEDLALSSFTFNEAGKVQIKGEAFNVESVANLIRTIDTSVILEKSEFSFLREKQVEDIRYYLFGILAKLKQQGEEAQ